MLKIIRWNVFLLLFVTVGNAHFIPFAFWKTQVITASFPPAHPCGTISGTQTFASNTTIDATAITTHQCKDWVVNTGVTLTFTTTTEAPIGSLTLNGTAQIVPGACTTSTCYAVNIFTKTDATIPSGAKISANGLGYLGGNSGGNSSQVKGRTLTNTTTGGAAGGTGGMMLYAGGSHAGYGGTTTDADIPNNTYGNFSAPVEVGSGGAGSTAFGAGTYGGNGGGAIKLTVSGTLTLNGIISADGNGPTSSVGGGGAGGSVWVRASTITTSASSAIITASGGNGGASYGSGSGGRIAIYYYTLTGLTISNTYIQSYGKGTGVFGGGAGTIFSKLHDDSSGDLLISGTSVGGYRPTPLGFFGYVSSAASASIIPTNMSAFLQTSAQIGKILLADVLSATPTTFTITSNTPTVISASAGGMSSATSSGKMWAMKTLDAALDTLTIAGQRVDAPVLSSSYVSNVVLSGSTILRTVYIENASSVALSNTASITTFDPTSANVFKVDISGTAMSLDTGTTISTKNLGYLGGNTTGNLVVTGRTIGNTTTGGAAGATGSFSYMSGGSHGGYGGTTTDNDTPNATYGVITQPITAGAGGAASTSFGVSNYAGGGGAAIKINLSGTLTLNGVINADGGAAASSSAGGGAGGSIWLTADTITTSAVSAIVRANGGVSSSTDTGCGGGGRIAIYYNTLTGLSITSTYVQAFGGSQGNAVVNGNAGTIYAKPLGPTLANLYLHNNGNTVTTTYYTPISEALNLDSLNVIGSANVKQMSTANAIATQNAVTVTAPGILKVPNNGSINNTGPWTWFTYGSVTGTITEY